MATVNAQGRIRFDDDLTPVSGWAVLQHGRVDPKLIFAQEKMARLYATMRLRGLADITQVTVTGSLVERR